MKQIILFAICLLPLGTGRLFCQNIGINTTGTNANISALLEVGEAANLTAGGDTKGLLCPHVQLTGLSDVTTIATPANGLIVYNTNSTIGNGVGLYFYCSSGCTTTGWKFMAAANNGPGNTNEVLTSQGAGNETKWAVPVVTTGGGGGNGCATCATQWGTASAGTMNWGTCARTCANSVEGGFTDWRMPTLKDDIELSAKLDAGTSANYHWTATPNGDDGIYPSGLGGTLGLFYIVSPSDGYWTYASASGINYCRCVR